MLLAVAEDHHELRLHQRLLDRGVRDAPAAAREVGETSHLYDMLPRAARRALRKGMLASLAAAPE